MSYLTHLECSLSGQTFDADRLWNLSPGYQKPLLARYDLEKIRRLLPKANLAGRPQNLWRYQEILPVRRPEYRFTLQEGFTPLVHARRLAQKLNFSNLFIKEEGMNPTTSFKARGLAVAVSRAVELGAKALSIPSAGNAASALSAYAALAGIPAYVFMPADVPHPFIAECKALGAEVTLVEGLITDCGKAAAEGLAKHGRFDMSTLKEPYRLEGKKTMGYELAEQLNWELPEVIIYPTGGGTGLIGMWKAFDEMEQLGWIGRKKPRMVAVQSSGCAPIVKAFQDGKDFAEPWRGARTIAEGLRVPAAVGDFLILRSLRESQGKAVAVSDEQMLAGATMIGRTQGIFTSPESGATLAAFLKLRKEGWIGDHERVVLFCTGSGHKYAHLWRR